MVSYKEAAFIRSNLQLILLPQQKKMILNEDPAPIQRHSAYPRLALEVTQLSLVIKAWTSTHRLGSGRSDP